MNLEKFKALAKGVAKKILQRRSYSDHTGGTNDSRYCYSVWMRHLVLKHLSNVGNKKGKVAELGPGDSFGIGLSCILSGYETYYALDVYKYWNAEKNLKIFDELVTLFKNRTPIPDDIEFPRVTPTLPNYQFPSQILTNELLATTLSDKRIQEIREEIKRLDTNPSQNKIIHYYIPWNDAKVIEPGTVDFIFSQAVLQYVDDLDSTYNFMNQWLRPGGIMSHSIDFSSHGITNAWNGHWTFSASEWKLAHGNNKILLNRAPLSTHTNLLHKHSFKIIKREDYPKESKFSQKDFHKDYQQLSNEDAKTFVSVIISKKN